MGNLFKSSNIRLVIGLGNPGREYAKTYHNAGVLFVSYVTQRCPSLFENGDLLASKELMNTSGNFVKKAVAYRNIKTSELMIAHDDSDLLLGEYKIDFNRGSAGHNGVASVIKSIRTQKFFRLRIGIRSKEAVSAPRKKASEFVLKKITPRDRKILESVFKNVCGNIIEK